MDEWLESVEFAIETSATLVVLDLGEKKGKGNRGMKIAVVGSRNFIDYKLLCAVLNEEFFWGKEILISGGAGGTDSLAEKWATENSIETIIIRPDYNKYPPKLAPLYRNQIIAKECDFMIAFWDGKSRGTKNAIEHAISFRKQVLIQGI